MFRLATIRRIEAAMLRAAPEGELMQRAAGEVAREASRMLRAMVPRSPVVLLIGPGNNGGDALYAGLRLQSAGYRVDAFAVDLIVDRGLDRKVVRSDDPGVGLNADGSHAPAPAAGTDAQRAWQAWAPRELHRLDALLDDAHWLETGPLVIDGLFGIGLTRALSPAFATLFAAIQGSHARVLAIDVPSGLDADTGMPADDGPMLNADATVTMIGDKIGLHTGTGATRSGRIFVAPLRAEPVPPDATLLDATLLDASSVAPLLVARSADSHKGGHGDLLVIGGRLGMEGAARLAARGALAAGAGKVTIGPAPGDAAGAVDPMRPEIMRTALSGALRVPARFDVVLIGCGLGLDAGAKALLRSALANEQTLVVDADALSLLGADSALSKRLAMRDAPAILTPHPLEAARLLGTSTREVQRDRVAAALRIAIRYRSIVVLKGPGTIIADPVGHVAINSSGGPILATGGTGDVLGGIIAALAATMSAAAAACAGVWLHGAAGDLIAAKRGAIGTPAADIATSLPGLLGRLIHATASTAALPIPDSTSSTRRPSAMLSTR